MKKKVLVGSCGGITGFYLIKHLRKVWPELFLLGTDTEARNPSRFFLDNFLQVPETKKEGDFINSLIFFIDKLDIEFYLPTHSMECKTVAKHIDEFNKTGVKILISPYESYLQLDNKLNAYNNLAQVGIKTPKIFNIDDKNLTFPLFAKPTYSSGSKGIRIINNYEEFLAVSKIEDYIISEYIEGNEYTIDILFDFQSNVFTYNQRRRLKLMGGAVVVAENDFTKDCIEEIALIGHTYKLKGPVNMQFFLNGKGEKVFFDINLRFASGGLPLSVKSGADIPVALIRILNEEHPLETEYASDRKKRRMYRYFEEIYEEINDI